MVITRLGQRRPDRPDRPEALQRTVRCCRFAPSLGSWHADASGWRHERRRDAENREEFATAVLDLTGSVLEVISGEREAGLSFLGGTHRLDPLTAAPPYVVLDIGGGSTELVVGTEPGRAEHAISTRMGSVRLTERFVRHDPPSSDELAQLEIAIDEVLDDAEAHVPVRDARTLIAVAGTATTLRRCAQLDR
jgi:exopolyphosphatase/guanosine-5'-triphosphate,3'-diphosphate pyrophosphatase